MAERAGVIVDGPEGPVQTAAFEIEGDVIRALYVVRNPDKLRHLARPGPGPAQNERAGVDANDQECLPMTLIVGFWGVRYQVKDVQRSISFYTRHSVSIWT